MIAPEAVIVESAFEEPPLPAVLHRPAHTLQGLALNKARHAHLPPRATGWVVGADTVVLLGKTPLGKPSSRKQAQEMLRTLSGQWQTVFSAVAVVPLSGEPTQSGVERTRVRFRNLSEAEITRYLKSDEWTDKAGAYGAQGLGAALIEEVRGSWNNVVGLPVALLVELLTEAGFLG